MDISKITGCNISGAREEIVTEENKNRVISSIKYIIESKCRPISVIKHGDNYYIDDGKHRFYAHILLGLGTIPTSLTDVRLNQETVSDYAELNANFKAGGGMCYVVDPHNCLDFINRYKDGFGRVLEIKMEKSEFLDGAFVFSVLNDKSEQITMRNCLTSGNSWISSKITEKIIRCLGFNVDSRFIKNNSCFVLHDELDAHNIDFETSVLTCSTFLNRIENESLSVKNFCSFSCKKQSEAIKLSNFINKHRFSSGAYFTPYNSFIIESNQNAYYVTGNDSPLNNQRSENGETVDCMYVFSCKDKVFNPLTITFLFKIDVTSKEYNQLLKNLNAKKPSV